MKSESKPKKKANFNRPDGENGEVKFAASQASVTLSRNAKGQPQFEVKVYSFDPEEAATKARELYKVLDKAMPYNHA